MTAQKQRPECHLRTSESALENRTRTRSGCSSVFGVRVLLNCARFHRPPDRVILIFSMAEIVSEQCSPVLILEALICSSRLIVLHEAYKIAYEISRL